MKQSSSVRVWSLTDKPEVVHVVLRQKKWLDIEGFGKLHAAVHPLRASMRMPAKLHFCVEQRLVLDHAIMQLSAYTSVYACL